MTRAREAITAQAESQGWVVTRIDWEPIGLGAEMEGPSGGWAIDLRRRDTTETEWAGGYNVAQVIQWIKNFDLNYAEREDPFACSGKKSHLLPGDCVAGRGHKGPHYPFRSHVPEEGAP